MTHAFSRVLLAGALSCAGMLSSAAEESIGLCLGEDMAQRLHVEMRQLLGALHGVHASLAARDFEALAARAAAVGSGMKGQVEQHAEAHHAGLPHEFMKLGRAMHASFDDLSTLARDGAKPRELLPALAQVSAQCVACHAKFHLAPSSACSTEEAPAP